MELALFASADLLGCIRGLIGGGMVDVTVSDGLINELAGVATSIVSLSGVTCAAVFSMVSVIKAVVCKSVDD